MMGLIALVTQARFPEALRKNTTLVIETIYGRESAPPEVMGFVDELASMLPDNLSNSALPYVATVTCQVMREIKDDRICREHGAFSDLDDGTGDNFADDLDHDDRDDDAAPKKQRKGRLSARLMILGGLAMLLSFSGICGGAYNCFFM